MTEYLVKLPFRGSVETAFENSRCRFTGLSPEEYIKEHDYLASEVQLVSPAEYATKFEQPFLKNLQGEWEEIKEEDYYRWLECVPPKKYSSIGDASIFFVGECYTHTIYRACIELNCKFYSALRDIHIPQADLIDELINKLKTE